MFYFNVHHSLSFGIGSHSQFSSLQGQFSFCTTSLNFGVECRVTCNVPKNGLELFQVLIFLLTQNLACCSQSLRFAL